MFDTLRIKIASVIAGKKAFRQLPLSFQSGGKTYYSLNKTDLEKFFKALNCDYTDQNLVELFGSIAEVYAPIHAIATRVANAKYELRKVSDDSPNPGTICIYP